MSNRKERRQKLQQQKPDDQWASESAIGNTNDDQLNRRNSIAQTLDESRKEDYADIDGDKVTGKFMADETEEEETAEEKEARAAKEDEDAQEALRKAGEGEVEGEEVKAEAEVEVKAEAKEDPDIKVIDGETYYRTVVNGREKWLTLGQLKTTAQKVESADEYLRNAAESAKTASKLALSSKEDESTDDDDLEATLTSVSLGDSEAIKKLAQRLKAPPSRVTPDVMLQAVDERLRFRRAADWFEDEYSDLLSDPFLKKLVLDKDSELSRDNPDLPYKVRMKQVGDEVREWKQKLTGNVVKPSAEKLARKASVANVPNASGRKAAPADEDAEENVESVIDKMAQARHQPRANRIPH
jgi:hypothetical protein